MINVVGAGFSGLVTAYNLTKQGLKVTVFERDKRAGGLISTERTPFGLVETAANAIVNSPAVEELFDDLRLEMLPSKRESRARYIFSKGRLKRWPLSIDGSVRMLAGLPFILQKSNKAKPKPLETVGDWSRRVLGEQAAKFLVAPALQGIYAGNPEEMSASLIFDRFFQEATSERPKIRGSVAPSNGMGQLIQKLEEYLIRNGVEIQYGQTLSAESVTRPTVFCGSAKAASQWLKPVEVVASQKLSQIELLPITTITIFMALRVTDTIGFGMLFPRGEGVEALGVLFNNHIFDNRSPVRSETWIYRGIDIGLEHVIKDREFSLRQETRPSEFRIQRWPEAIPHYTLQLEKTLNDGLILPKNIYLMGNYLGDIGLARILERSKKQALKIKETGF
jgi:protoporphyrinogen/coproporphyrinogen III oxidase